MTTNTQRKDARQARRAFGSTRRLPSGRVQASYVDPLTGKRVPADSTFDTKADAEDWLVKVRQTFAKAPGGYAPPPPSQGQRLGVYGREWILGRVLAPRTRADYLTLFVDHIEPELGNIPITSLTIGTIKNWYERLLPHAPVKRAHVYGLLRTMMKSAVRNRLIVENPVDIEGALGKKKTTPKTRKIAGRVASPLEVAKLTAAMPERLRAAITIAAWCGLRYGEIFELRRADLTLVDDGVTRIGIVDVTRGVTFPSGKAVVEKIVQPREVGDPKSRAGDRTIAIPSALVPGLIEHLREHVGPDPDALLFPAVRGGGNMRPSSFYGAFYPAREAVGLKDLRFHDLRHTGATYAAQAGATLAELMHRIGHATPHAAMRYQHAVSERDREIAEKMSGMTGLGDAS